MRQYATMIPDGVPEDALRASEQRSIWARAALAMACAVAGLLWLPLALPLGSPWVALAVQLAVAVAIPIWLGLTAWDRVRESDGHLRGRRLALAAAVIGAVNIPVSIVVVLLCLAGLWLAPIWMVWAWQGW